MSINISIELLKVIMFPDGRLDTTNAAIYLDLSDKTLAMMRCNGTGPIFLKRGRIFYYKEDLDSWLNAHGRFSSTAQAQRELQAKKEQGPLQDSERKERGQMKKQGRMKAGVLLQDRGPPKDEMS